MWFFIPEMIDSPLLTHLLTEQDPTRRLQYLLASLRHHFACDAVALLQSDGEALTPLAIDGLVQEALGRRFVVAQHPRLAALLAAEAGACFAAECDWPDPYDGLVAAHSGQPLPVHACMGMPIRVDQALWGVLTLDSLQHSAFEADALVRLRRWHDLVALTLRVNRLEAQGRLAALAVAEPVRAGTDEPPLLGQSPAFRRLLQEIDTVAASDLPVLLLGETGVGKELVARRLHAASPRQAAPLVQVNCAALPESLAESELFGHARGTFSGASQERAGRFEAADGGTLFLDEVGELPLAVQAKLLRALQNGEIQRLGEDRPRKVDVRIVAATNRALAEQVRDGAFRADLYHRLSVYPLPIPPLRERGNDVLLLAGYFLELNRARLGCRSLRLSVSAEAALCRYGWPGNVRELEHVISRAALRVASRARSRNAILTLEPELLGLAPGGSPEAEPVSATIAQPLTALPLKLAVEQYQRELIRRTLDQCDDNWAQAARALGLDASNLHKLARRLGLKSA